jgi:hypothetical protein
MAQVYSNDAMERIDRAGKEAIHAFAEGDEQKMMLLGLKRFTKTEALNAKALRREIAAKLIEANGWCF